jgi:tetratricopeptide (TPR) repeat protein
MNISNFKFQKSLSLLLVLMMNLSIAALNQPDETSGDMELALSYFQKQEWDKAAQAFREIVNKNKDDGQAWFYLGLTLHSMKKYQPALEAYFKAENLKYALPRTRYNITCTYSLLNDKEKALEWLTKAINAGFTQLKILTTDQDLANLHSDARFQEVVNQLEAKINPCLHHPKYQEFDFWVGNWDVFNMNGTKVGVNKIQRILQGCMIFENWTSIRGSQGKSINYYDPSSGKWRQNWIDENGQLIWYEGEVKNGAMHFSGKLIDKDGNQEIARVLLEPVEGGKVHHLIEHSKDDGATWYVWFEGTYIRQTDKAADK